MIKIRSPRNISTIDDGARIGAGTANHKCAPFPSLLSTSIRPPIRSQIRLQIVRPRPVPPWLRVSTSLPERLEQLGLMRFIDANAGIDHIDPQFIKAARPRTIRGGHHDFAALGEFDRVTDQISDQLAEATRVANDLIWQQRISKDSRSPFSSTLV